MDDLLADYWKKLQNTPSTSGVDSIMRGLGNLNVQGSREAELRKLKGNYYRIKKEKQLAENMKASASQHLETRYNFYTGYVDALRQSDIKKYGPIWGEEETPPKKIDMGKKKQKKSKKSSKKTREEKLVEQSNEEKPVIAEVAGEMEPQPGPSGLSNSAHKPEKRKKESENVSISDEDRRRLKQPRIENVEEENQAAGFERPVQNDDWSNDLNRYGTKRKNTLNYRNSDSLRGRRKVFCRENSSSSDESNTDSSSSTDSWASAEIIKRRILPPRYNCGGRIPGPSASPSTSDIPGNRMMSNNEPIPGCSHESEGDLVKKWIAAPSEMPGPKPSTGAIRKVKSTSKNNTRLEIDNLSADPNIDQQRRYCLCRRAAFEQMIACDKDDVSSLIEPDDKDKTK